MHTEVDTTPLETVFREDYARLCRVAWALAGDRSRAEELVMEAFAKTLADWSKVRDPGAAHAYLRKVVVRTCHDHLRRRRTEWRVNALHAARTPDVLDPHDHDDAVLLAVRALPLRQRTVVVLTYYCDLSEAAVAEAMDVSTGTVKSQLSKARATLARALKEES